MATIWKMENIITGIYFKMNNYEHYEQHQFRCCFILSYNCSICHNNNCFLVGLAHIVDFFSAFSNYIADVIDDISVRVSEEFMWTWRGRPIKATIITFVTLDSF